MGAQIAAMVANAGVPVLLLDQTREAARLGVARARQMKPDPAFTAETWALVTPGSLDEDLTQAGACDWIIEAVVEDAAVKRGLLGRVDLVRRPETLVTSNTSALSIASLAEGRSDGFRQHWCGTHFFNPPRYLPLLELVPTSDTASAAVSRMAAFCDHRLGKSVVIARDTPGFIANHLGLYGAARVLAEIDAGRITIEEADALTGAAIGRPKSATCRTLDLTGLDVVARVAADLRERLIDAQAGRVLTLPSVVTRLVAAGALGEKAGRGFYQRVRLADGRSRVDVLDPATLAYREFRTPHLESLTATRAISDTGARIRTLFNGADRAGTFLRATLAPTLVYAARVAPDLAASIDDIDRVMRWGFGWELGPFETIDAIGARDVVQSAFAADPQLMAAGVPPLLQSLVERESERGSGRGSGRGLEQFRSGRVPPAAADLLILRSAKDRTATVATSEGASLVDLGDGVLAVEFHSKLNTLGQDAVEMLERGVAEAEARFAALVIGNEAPHFSAGADLTLVLEAAGRKDWGRIDQMVRALQAATMRLRYAAVPVVAAPAGLTLGGGVEITLHAHRAQAAAESYLGLVETGVGLIPAGGGTKEMLARAVERAAGTDPTPHVQRAFETIAFGTVSGSAADARRLGLLSPSDGITMNRERLMSDAKTVALAAVSAGYVAPMPRRTMAVGGDGIYAPLALAVHLAWRAGRISQHDAVIGRALATVMAGGRMPHSTTVTEQHLLDLEREAFLGLVAQARTQDRIRHTLETGTPLRN